MTTHQLAQELRRHVNDRVETILTRYWPSLRLPGFFAGFRIDDTFAVDAAGVVATLHEAGVRTIAGRSSLDIVRTILIQIDGPKTDTFYSYRIAEMLIRFGGMDPVRNPVLAGMSPAQIDNLIAAVDSTHIYNQWDKPLGGRPNNYWAVLARCEHARDALGLVSDDRIYRESVEHCKRLLAHNPLGYFDDDRNNAGKYDIYSADVVLFLQPLWERVGMEMMRERLATHVQLLETIAHESGASVAWGRSVGAHSVAMTLELASVAVAKGIGDRSRLAGLASHAFDRLREYWFDNGLTRAHRGPMTSTYRGPHRLLQMTFDLFNKLLYAADELASADALPIATDRAMLFPNVDAHIPFEPSRSAGAWSYRDRDWSFQLPLVATHRSDYVAFPRSPGVLDVPVDSDMVCGTPRVVVGGVEYVGAGLPDDVSHEPGQVRAVYRRFVASNAKAEPAAIDATREVRWRVDGRDIVIDESWTFPVAPSAIHYTIAESERRLCVRFECDALHDASVVDVSGMPTMRGYFAPLSRLHQITLVEPRTHHRLTTRIAPSIRVAHAPASHDYNRTIYDAFPPSEVYEIRRENGLSPHSAVTVDAFAADAQIVHLGWFEYLFARQMVPFPQYLERVVEFVQRLRERGTRLVWTMHNRRPHYLPADEGRALYRAVAPFADAAIHHSACGMRLMRSELPYRDDCVHVVIPHAHFGEQMHVDASRASLEAKYNLPPCAVRFGVLGRYQPEKQVELIVRAFRSAARADHQLVLTAYKKDVDLGDAGDARIIRLPRGDWMQRSEIAEHNAVCDALITAHTGDTYLTSGVAADAIGAGLAMLCPPWDYFREILGDASIEYDGTEAGLTALLASVKGSQIDASKQATAPLRDQYAPKRIAADHLELFERLLA
jgi:glycosyltransferase involved in cell wall biosynthesis